MQSCPRKQRETGVFKEVWKAHNLLLDFCREIAPQQSGSQGVLVDRKSNGTAYKIIPGKQRGTAGKVSMMMVLAVGNDTLSCRDLETDEQLTVARAWTHRSTPFHGNTIEFIDENGAAYSATFNYLSPILREVTIGNVVERQWLNPVMKPGFDHIVAAQCAETEVAGVDWIDLNNDGRAWAKV